MRIVLTPMRPQATANSAAAEEQPTFPPTLVNRTFLAVSVGDSAAAEAMNRKLSIGMKLGSANVRSRLLASLALSAGTVAVTGKPRTLAISEEVLTVVRRASRARLRRRARHIPIAKPVGNTLVATGETGFFGVSISDVN